MNHRPSAGVLALVLCAACNFDPSAFGGGGSDDGDGNIGGDNTDGSPGGDGTAVDGSSTGDASYSDCSAACPGLCDDQGTCHIVCGGDQGGGGSGLLPGDENPPPCGPVSCPAGFDCYVHCVGQNACDQPIDCTQSSSCRIDCSDDNSCASQLSCGDGLCEIHCDGSQSCGGGVSCASSCFCDVSCSGESSCGQQAVCPAGCDADPDCKTTGAGCSSSC